MRKHKIKAAVLSFIMAIGLVGLVSYPAQASRWVTIQDEVDPLTGCHITVQTCNRGFGLAFCDVGSTRKTETCPPSGN